MKKYFWLGFTGLFLFELSNVYFIMPMPGSQRMNSIDLAYFLYKWRWGFRIFFVLLILLGLFRSIWKRKWIPVTCLILLTAVIYMANFKMAADVMFRQPQQLLLADAAHNKVDPGRLVIGVEINGEARAYPIRFLGYHHHIQDTVGGKNILVTYCTVCRSGRVFDPLVNGKKMDFRLVGMDHFNAMLEDKATGSWWRQATGGAIAGKLKGQQLTEIISYQCTLAKWLSLYPDSRIMQADTAFTRSYDTNLNYEDGSSKKALTGTDSISWNEKSWVIGVRAGDIRKAYDWKLLKKERIIYDSIGSTALIVVLANDEKSFFSFAVSGLKKPVLQNDTLISGSFHFTINGKGIDTSYNLSPIPAYQEFWHSWKTFNPGTRQSGY